MSLAISIAVVSFLSLGLAEDPMPMCDPPMPPPMYTQVRWGDVKPTGFRARFQCPEEASGCNVFLCSGYSKDIMRSYMNVTEESLMVDGLELRTVYNVRVECVYNGGCRSQMGLPGRTRTFGTPRTTTTTTPAPTAPTPVGKCGKGYFTCETNETECVDESFWCDKSKDCADGTDERNCPGACTEITSFHKAGNFSCSRWNSRKSACFFQCNGEFVRDGPWYTMCVHDKWTRRVPTCRLRRVSVVISNDGLIPNSIQVTFNALNDVEDYVVNSVIDVDTKIPMVTTFNYEINDGVVEGIIGDLAAGKTYEVNLAAVDADGVEGFPSRSRYGRTAPMRGTDKDFDVES
ncbi:uncharacterized protein LOC143471163 [Clavelina lepadiformis]|uniref:uncharacterized protein LOC143471163 n=1 Tax=Clavelina lepadiformis TaxID=159417 RepID=UPI0040418CD3